MSRIATCRSCQERVTAPEGLDEGQRVEFNVAQGQKGLQAQDVMVIG